jgi:putative membrane protein insertion efficiency factor
MSALLVILVQTGLPLRLELTAIRIYQASISPLTRKIVNCRFDPSCSTYALQALEESGFWWGNGRIAGRLMMCSPIGYLVERWALSGPVVDSQTSKGADLATSGKR